MHRGCVPDGRGYNRIRLLIASVYSIDIVFDVSNCVNVTVYCT